MEKAVEISETKEQRFVLDKKERYLTDMAALRKETILKFQLKTWAVKPTPDGIRADQMEVALSYAKVGRNKITSFYGSSCAKNGKGALNTPDARPLFSPPCVRLPAGAPTAR
eukprot:1192192-Prorocentrum_minimum.AAC.2